MDQLDKNQKDKIYHFIVKNYARYWKIGFNDLNFKVIRNFDLFIKNYQPSEKLKKELAELFYSTLLLNDLSIYHEEKFINTFSKTYPSLSKDIREKFEDQVVQLLAEYNKNSNWNGENYITDSISPLWESFSRVAQENLKGIYLNIYIRDTLDKFPQKKFAKKLVDQSSIDKEYAKSWLEKEIYEFISDNGKDAAIENSSFLARTYFNLVSIIEPEEKWLTFIDKKIRSA